MHTQFHRDVLCMHCMESEKAPGRPESRLSVPKGDVSRKGIDSSRVCYDRTKGNSFILKEGI